MRRLMACLGAAAIVLGFMYLAWPVGHIPPYDANLTRLAETELQGFCSGDAFMKSQGMGSKSLASACRAKYAKQMSNKPDMMIVQRAFCQAVVANGWTGTIQDCVAILTEDQYWPTYDGSITDQWNRARPYPQPLISAGAGSQNNTSRTGNRAGNQRQNNPTHQTPRYYAP